MLQFNAAVPGAVRFDQKESEVLTEWKDRVAVVLPMTVVMVLIGAVALVERLTDAYEGLEYVGIDTGVPIVLVRKT